LRSILNCDVVARTVAKKIPHSISAIANHNKTIAYPGVAQSFDDVLEHWFPAHHDHWLRKLGGKLAHAGATARCKHDSFVDCSHGFKSKDSG
jgi:hypothetical protein